LDYDNSGKISRAEFERFISLEDVSSTFQSLDIDVHDALHLFTVLDLDGNDELEIEEFVLGCFRVQGEATAVSMRLLLQENQGAMRKSKDMAQALHGRLGKTEEHLNGKLLDLQDMVSAIHPEVVSRTPKQTRL